MFSTVLTQVTGLFDSGKEFLRTYFFPVLVFAGGVAAVSMETAGQIDSKLTQFQELNSVLQIGWIAVGLAGVAVTASVLASLRTVLLRLYEGYWPWPLDKLARLRAKHWTKYLKQLRQIDEIEYRRRTYYEFPVPSADEFESGRSLMPTKLGNALKASEVYSNARYSADAVVLWPRLYQVLPKEFQGQVNTAEVSVGFGLTISFLSGLFAVVAGIIMLGQGRSIGLFLLFVLGSFAVSWMAYIAAFHAALPYGELIRTGFDLYRGKLLEELGFEKLDKPDPKKPLEARQLWKEINLFVYRGGEVFERRFRYPTSTPEKSEPSKPADFKASIGPCDLEFPIEKKPDNEGAGP